MDNINKNSSTESSEKNSEGNIFTKESSDGKSKNSSTESSEKNSEGNILLKNLWMEKVKIPLQNLRRKILKITF